MNHTQTAQRKLLDELKLNLIRQSDCLKACIKLCRAQRRALIKNDFDANQSINVELDGLSQKLSNLERRRISQLKAIQTHIFGEMRAELSLDELLMHAPIELQDVLKAVQNGLKADISRLKNLFQTNAILIQNARKMNQASIALLTGISDKDTGKQREVYGINGRKKQKVPQKRSLYNQKA